MKEFSKILPFLVLLLDIALYSIYCPAAGADPSSVDSHIQDSEGDLLNLPGSGIIMGTVASTGVPSQQDTSPVTPPPLQPPCYMRCPCGPAIPCGSDVSRCEKPAYCGNGIFAPCGQPCPPLVCEEKESSRRVVSSDGIKSSSVQRVSSNVRSSSLQVVSSSRRESSRALPVSQSTTTSQGSRECGFDGCVSGPDCNSCCNYALDCCNAECMATIPSTTPNFSPEQLECRNGCLVDSNNCTRSCTGSCNSQMAVSCWNAMMNGFKTRFNMTDADVKAWRDAADVIMKNCYVNQNTGRSVTDSDICDLQRDVLFMTDKDGISNRIEEWLAQWEAEARRIPNTDDGGLPEFDFGRCAGQVNESLCKTCCANENLTCWTRCNYTYSEQSQILSCRNNCDEKHGICENSCGNKLGSSSKALQSSSLKSVSRISSPLAVSSSVKQSSSLRAVSSSRAPSSSKMWSSSLRLSSSNVLSSAAVPECDRDVCHKDCQEKLPACVEAMYGDFNPSLLSNLVRSHSVCTNELTACQSNCRDKVKNPDCQVIFEPCKTDIRRAACGAEICMNEDNREVECKRRGYQGADLDDCKKNITCSCDSDCKPSFDYTRKEASSISSLKRSSLLKSSSRISSSRVVSSSKKQSSSLRVVSSSRVPSSSKKQSSLSRQSSSLKAIPSSAQRQSSSRIAVSSSGNKDMCDNPEECMRFCNNTDAIKEACTYTVDTGTYTIRNATLSNPGGTKVPVVKTIVSEGCMARAKVACLASCKKECQPSYATPTCGMGDGLEESCKELQCYISETACSKALPLLQSHYYYLTSSWGVLDACVRAAKANCYASCDQKCVPNTEIGCPDEVKTICHRNRCDTYKISEDPAAWQCLVEKPQVVWNRECRNVCNECIYPDPYKIGYAAERKPRCN